MLRHLIILIILFLFISKLPAQEKNKNYFILQGIVDENGDTIPVIKLNEIVIHPKLKFKDNKQSIRYNKLVYNVRVTYPYAKLAQSKLHEMNQYFLTLDKEKDQQKYVKQVEKELVKDFSDELRDLTVSQGRILIKLIDRETGNTSYDLVKELRGAVRAFFWQTLARMFGSNLKSEYDPNGEDWLIEQIVVMMECGEIQPISRKITAKR